MALIGKYKEHDLNFTAYEKHRHSEVGDQIIFLGGSGAFTFQVDDGVTNQVRAGISFKMPDGQSFSNITFNESAGATGNILFAIASGNVVDARSVISGETPILNSAAPNNILAVHDSALDTLLKNTDDKRTALTDLRSSTVFSTDTKTTTHDIVLAASNTGGIYIRHMMLSRYGVQQSYVYVNSLPFLQSASTVSSDGQTDIVRDVILPASVDFQIASYGTGSFRFTCYYDLV